MIIPAYILREQLYQYGGESRDGIAHGLYQAAL